MPWKIKKRGNKWCVVKEGTTSPVPGGCHATRAEAVRHQRALYRGEKTATEGGVTMQNNWISVANATGGNGNYTTTFTTPFTFSFAATEAVEALEELAEEERPATGLPHWEAVLAFEGLATSDRRLLMPGKVTHRDLPLSMMAQTVTAEGHDGAACAGNIIRIWREDRDDLGEGVVAIMGAGEFADNEEGREAAKLVEDQMLRGVSIDLAVDQVQLLDPDNYEPVDEEEVDFVDVLDGKYLRGVSGEIMGATLVPFPAFGDAHMEVIYEDAPLVASAPRMWDVEGQQLKLVKPQALTAAAAGFAPMAPPREWFEQPEADVPTPLTVTEDGRVFGHLALWGQCHSGFPGCELANPSKSAYAYFHTGALKCADGSEINVGRITVGEKGGAKGGHASIVLGTQGAIEHYDNTACVGAYVRAVDGKLGIWLSGAVRSDCPAERVRDMKANPPSGDWRWEKTCRELVAALCVPVGGFAIPRFEARVASAGHEDVVMALVATGFVQREVAPMNRAEQRRFHTLKRQAHEWLVLSAPVEEVEDAGTE